MNEISGHGTELHALLVAEGNICFVFFTEGFVLYNHVVFHSAQIPQLFYPVLSSAFLGGGGGEGNNNENRSKGKLSSPLGYTT